MDEKNKRQLVNLAAIERPEYGLLAFLWVSSWLFVKTSVSEIENRSIPIAFYEVAIFKKW